MNVLNVNPGLIVWTLLNFSIFFFLLFKFGWKPLKESLKQREDSINDAIANAENANKEAMRIMKENQEKLAGAQQEVMNIVKDGRVQAEKIISKATEEAEFIKNQKLAETEREMNRMKDEAFTQLRAEVATLVMNATEKILDQKLDASSHKQLIDSAIAQVSKN
ncbi:MAG: F0F1 ATP synthase subunit B [Candidatus Kapabacteria bacterium]|nr:F0F1 ATP synthase subunit B [Candidatus Kapabacteria bacterium]